MGRVSRGRARGWGSRDKERGRGSNKERGRASRAGPRAEIERTAYSWSASQTSDSVNTPSLYSIRWNPPIDLAEDPRLLLGSQPGSPPCGFMVGSMAVHTTLVFI